MFGFEPKIFHFLCEFIVVLATSSTKQKQKSFFQIITGVDVSVSVVSQGFIGRKELFGFGCRLAKLDW